MLIEVKDVTSRLPSTVYLSQEDEERLGILIGDAEEAVRDAFARSGRNFDAAIATEWVGNAARRVIREMVSAAIIIGPNAGVRSASSSTGQESDSVTYANVDSVSFAGVRLTDAQRKALGLGGEGLPRGSFPPPRRWPEVIHRG